jgi:hypothetical protein
MRTNCIYLDTYILQQDMRVRMPKTILANLNLEKGKSKFDIFMDKEAEEIILKLHHDIDESEDKKGVKNAKHIKR